jgi:hypothetical protein
VHIVTAFEPCLLLLIVTSRTRQWFVLFSDIICKSGCLRKKILRFDLNNLFFFVFRKVKLRFLLVVTRSNKCLCFITLIIIPTGCYAWKSALSLFGETCKDRIRDCFDLFLNLSANRLRINIILQNSLLLIFAFISSGSWCCWYSSFSLWDKHRWTTFYFLSYANIVKTRLAQQRRLDILAWPRSLYVFNVNKSPFSRSKDAIFTPSFLLNHVNYWGNLIATWTWNTINYILHGIF